MVSDNEEANGKEMVLTEKMIYSKTIIFSNRVFFFHGLNCFMK